MNPKWVSEIRHLAIPFPPSDLYLYTMLSRALSGLDSLESVSIVYSSLSGRVDYLNETALPAWNGAGLKLLDAIEMDDDHISRDYIQQIWDDYRLTN